MEDDFFVESVYRRFDAAIDRIDTRERSPTPHEAEMLTQALDQIKAQNFERAGELLDAVNQTIVASALGAKSDGPAADTLTTRDLRDKLREIRTLPM
ncbi:MAG: hypothetical protein ACXWI7_04570 [Croceibacterium sp.]